ALAEVAWWLGLVDESLAAGELAVSAIEASLAGIDDQLTRFPLRCRTGGDRAPGRGFRART
ncbi:hypothetical protein, partial [Phytoactinopolyspora endophytica]|uniref:hypothetical protein n=1 Tax=Phytoactinopolyspora endophytica TaxID=1642495 RepID=UPI00197B2BE6